MTEEMEKYIAEFEEMLDLVHDSKTCEALELTNDQKVSLFGFWIKEQGVPGNSGGASYGGGGGFKGGGGYTSKYNPIKMDGINQNGYDDVRTYLTDIGFKKDDGTKWENYKAKSDLNDTISVSYSDKFKDWGFQFWNKELKSYVKVEKTYSKQLEMLKIYVDVICGREQLQAVCDDIKSEDDTTPLDSTE